MKACRVINGRPFGNLFKEWLKETQGLTDDEIKDIMEMATNGKLELEESAKRFLEN